MPRTVLSVRGITKTFVGQKALDRVSIDIYSGEIHALLGENGSGKSTLIKCLAGYYEPDKGSVIELDGSPLAFPLSTRQATNLGMVFVHQDLGLIPNLSVAENFAITQGYETRLLGKINWKKIREEAIEQLSRLNRSDIDIDIPISRLPVSTQTIVAIARAMNSASSNAKILVLDEPTAALPDAEADLLFEAVRSVTLQGVAVVYVSHKLEEIIRIADRATILRDGKLIQTVDCKGLTESDLIKLIVGKEVEFAVHKKARSFSTNALQVSNLSANRLKDVTFDISQGEIVGLVGMLGSGRSELARILFGAQQRRGGTLTLFGKDLKLTSPRSAVQAGIALIPENRRRDGGVLDMPIGKNLTLPKLRSYFERGLISTRHERQDVDSMIANYSIRPADSKRAFKFFSGGNQQKVVIAKWMHTEPKLVIFDEPVQGVDYGARVEIFDLVRKASEEGTSVLLISSEIDLMLSVCDRLLVLRDGEIIANLANSKLTRSEVSQLIYFGQNN
jgi:ABC-type sugar transport system ATPase subunit